MIRIPGQRPAMAGAVRHRGIVVTSGIISPGLLGSGLPDSGPAPGIAEQFDGAVRTLGEMLQAAGSDLAHVLRIEAFLARAADFPRWDEVFAATWPLAPPARTTLVSGFALPAVLVELQAIAAPRRRLTPRRGAVARRALPRTGSP